MFVGAMHYEVSVEGRNLWRRYDYCSLRRWPCICEATRDMDQEGEVVTAIKIRDVTPNYDE